MNRSLPLSDMSDNRYDSRDWTSILSRQSDMLGNRCDLVDLQYIHLLLFDTQNNKKHITDLLDKMLLPIDN